MANENKKNANRRFLGKVKTQNGQHGPFQKIYIDNPNAKDKDGNPNQYFKGALLWLDVETGKKFYVKQFSVRGVGEASLQKGFSNSISIDLDNEYETQEA